MILYLSHMLALPDGAYETQGTGPEAPRAETNRYPKRFRINLAGRFSNQIRSSLSDCSMFIAVSNQRTTRLTDLPYCVSFAPLISSMWRIPGELSRPRSNIQP